MHLDSNGYVCLGPQPYRALVLYHPEFGDLKELAFFQKAARGRTALFQVGDWTRDFEALPLDAAARLAGNIRLCPDDKACQEFPSPAGTPLGLRRAPSLGTPCCAGIFAGTAGLAPPGGCGICRPSRPAASEARRLWPKGWCC